MRPPDIGRAPTVVIAIGALALLAPGALRLARSAERNDLEQRPAPAVEGIHATNPSEPSAPPASVWAATLRDELFPEPPPPAPEAAAPTPLAIELIAVSERAGRRTAFVYDATAKEFVEVALGATLPSGAVLTELESHAAVFERSDQHARLELKR